MDIPVQTNQNSRLRRRASQSFQDPVRLAFDKLNAHQKQSLLQSHYERKDILKIPQEILEANPDKYMVWINFNTLKSQGMFHPLGYRLFRTEQDLESTKDMKFDDFGDGFVHRNEMVLAYLPMEDHLEIEMEKMAAREERDLTDLITKNEALSRFAPTGKETVEHYVVKAEQKEQQGGANG